MDSSETFSGSYLPDDVQFLLRRLELEPVHLEEREQRIQSGTSHYSEMIGPEDAPTIGRVRLFRESLGISGQRLATDLVRLADLLIASVPEGGEITIASIARAGTPIGVLLQRLIRSRLGPDRVRHYSMSIIRDRGIDLCALNWIAARHPIESIRFVDGWTGKGTIAKELAESLAQAPAYHGKIDAGLWVPLDASGAARGAASTEDYLIPSSLLGGTISGLVSRSVLPRSDIGADRFHGCVALQNLKRYDLSRWFVDVMEVLCHQVKLAKPVDSTIDPVARFAASQRFIDDLMVEFAIEDRNRVKIGIGETVRVLLRRLPERVLLRDFDNPNVALIDRLAKLRGVEVVNRPDMPHTAVGLIADVKARL